MTEKVEWTRERAIALLSMIESNHPDLSEKTGWEDENCQVAYVGGLLWAAAHDEADLDGLKSRLARAQAARAARRARYANC
jgi:hypothetical protein